MVSAMLMQSNTPKCQLLLTRNFTIQGCPRSGWMHSFLYYAGCGFCWIYSLVLSSFLAPLFTCPAAHDGSMRRVSKPVAKALPAGNMTDSCGLNRPEMLEGSEFVMQSAQNGSLNRN